MSPNSKLQRRGRGFLRPAVVAIAIVWLTYMVPAAGFFLIDPYELYPWGVKVKLPRANGGLGAAKLMRAAAKDRSIDTVLIGSSPTLLYTPEDIQQVFPDSHRAWNASYLAGWNAARLTVLDEFIRYSNAKHYIVSIDLSVTQPLAPDNQIFPDAAYNYYPTDYFRMLGPDSLLDAWSALHTGNPIHGSEHFDPYPADTFNRNVPLFHNPKEYARIRKSIAAHRGDIYVPGKTRCSEFEMFEPLVSRIAALSARGARVDAVIPVYSPAIFYYWRGSAGERHITEPQFLADQLLFRKCLVLALSKIPRTTVSSADLDNGLASDIRNFYDPGHLRGHARLMRVLEAINDPHYRLTPATIDHYIRAEIDLVRKFDLDHPASN